MYRYTDWCTVPACTQVHAEASKTDHFNFILAFEDLMPRLQNHSNYYFNFKYD
jgi:hypothetical protein